MARSKKPLIAEAEEVLAFYTSIMRGSVKDEEAPSIADQCKAAEMLGRHYRLFEDHGEIRPDSGTVTAVREAMERLKKQHADGST